MQFKELEDDNLLARAQNLAQKERNLTLELLEHIREIECRKLFAKLGYSSILKYLVKELKYSEGQAYRRMQAARLLKAVPEAAQDLSRGTLNLQTACQVERFGRQEHLDREQKRSLLKTVQGKSSQAVEQMLFELSDRDYSGPDQRRQVSTTKTELKFCLQSESIERLERVKQLLAVKQLNQDAAVIDYVLEFFLRIKDPMRQKTQNPVEASAAAVQKVSAEIKLYVKGLEKWDEVKQFISNSAEAELQQHTEKVHKKNQSMESSIQKNAVKKNSSSKYQRYVKTSDRRQVWLRASGQCEYIGCGERYGLELDHVRPISLGGDSKLDNLRLLCRQHNQWVAMKLGKIKCVNEKA